MTVAPARYDLAWLVPGWRSHLGAPLEPSLAGELAERLAGWLDCGLPAVVRRRLPGEVGVPLGVALPPGGASRRVALLVAPEAILRLAPPPPLTAALASAPAAWKAPLRALAAEADAAGVALAVHGSLAWQHLSGRRYLHASSDVDLLLRPRDEAALTRILAVLARREGSSPRLDGEVLLGDAAVSWRELAGGAARLLAKSEGEVALLPRSALLARLGRAA